MYILQGNLCAGGDPNPRPRVDTAPPESSSHILGQCPASKGARIARHHKMCALLTAEAEGLGWTVSREWAFRTSSGEMRLIDLIFVRECEALAVDVTV